MAAFQKIAVAGKGLLGSAIIEQLANSGYAVTVLSRDPSGLQGLPSGVKTAKVNYDSKESIVEALRGQDVLVATFGTGGVLNQHFIIDASIEAGVKRYVPSDYGTFTTDPKARDLVIIQPYIQTQDYLKKKAEAGEIEWTIFSTGSFLDYVVNFPLVADYDNHTIQVYDGGKYPVSSTSLASIGKAIAGALRKPEETRNRNLLIHETVIIPAKVVEWANKYSPPGTKWTVTDLPAQKTFDEYLEKLRQNPADPNVFLPLLKTAVMGGFYRSAYPQVDNELVGLPLLKDGELEAKFAEKFQQA